MGALIELAGRSRGVDEGEVVLDRAEDELRKFWGNMEASAGFQSSFGAMEDRLSGLSSSTADPEAAFLGRIDGIGPASREYYDICRRLHRMVGSGEKVYVIWLFLMFGGYKNPAIYQRIHKCNGILAMFSQTVEGVREELAVERAASAEASGLSAVTELTTVAAKGLAGLQSVVEDCARRLVDARAAVGALRSSDATDGDAARAKRLSAIARAKAKVVAIEAEYEKMMARLDSAMGEPSSDELDIAYRACRYGDKSTSTEEALAHVFTLRADRREELLKAIRSECTSMELAARAAYQLVRGKGKRLGWGFR